MKNPDIGIPTHISKTGLPHLTFRLKQLVQLATTAYSAHVALITRTKMAAPIYLFTYVVWVHYKTDNSINERYKGSTTDSKSKTVAIVEKRQRIKRRRALSLFHKSNYLLVSNSSRHPVLLICFTRLWI